MNRYRRNYADDTPRLKLSDLNKSVFRRVLCSGQWDTPQPEETTLASGQFTLGGIVYYYTFSSMDIDERFRLRLKWTKGGIERSTTIPVLYLRSALSRRGYLRFICPIAGTQCLKLYQDSSGYLGSIKAFGKQLSYRSQYDKLSRAKTSRGIALRQVQEETKLLESAPDMYYKHRSHLGRITPSGKRLLKYIAKWQKYDKQYHRRKPPKIAI